MRGAILFLVVAIFGLDIIGHWPASAQIPVEQHGVSRPVKLSVEGTEKELYAGSYALIISIGNYQNLTDPDEYHAEASDLRNALISHGFEVSVIKDPREPQPLLDEIRQFVEHATATSSRVIIYVVGHGEMNYSTKTAHLMLADAPDRQYRPVSEWKLHSVSSVQLQEAILRNNARHLLLVLNTCASHVLAGAYLGGRDPYYGYVDVDRYERLSKPSVMFLSAGKNEEKVHNPSGVGPLLALLLRGERSAQANGLFSIRDIYEDLRRVLAHRTNGFRSEPQFGFLPSQIGGEMIFLKQVTHPPIGSLSKDRLVGIPFDGEDGAVRFDEIGDNLPRWAFLGETVKYFHRLGDDEAIHQMAAAHSVPITISMPVVTELSDDARTEQRGNNAIACRTDTTIDALKFLALAMIRFGAELRYIGPVRNVEASKPGELQILRYPVADGFRLLTEADVEALTSCPSQGYWGGEAVAPAL